MIGVGEDAAALERADVGPGPGAREAHADGDRVPVDADDRERAPGWGGGERRQRAAGSGPCRGVRQWPGQLEAVDQAGYGAAPPVCTALPERGRVDAVCLRHLDGDVVVGSELPGGREVHLVPHGGHGDGQPGGDQGDQKGQQQEDAEQVERQPSAHRTSCAHAATVTRPRSCGSRVATASCTPCESRRSTAPGGPAGSPSPSRPWQRPHCATSSCRRDPRRRSRTGRTSRPGL